MGLGDAGDNPCGWVLYWAGNQKIMPNIRELIDHRLATRYYQHLSQPQDYWRMSSIGMPYDSYHRRAGSTPDWVGYTDPQTGEELTEYDLASGELRMDLGTSIHRIIQDLLKDIELEGEIELLLMEDELSDESLRLKGHPDILVLFKSGGKQVLYDIKTVNDKSYDHMGRDAKKCGFDGPLKPYDHHVKQVHLYQHEIHKQYNILADEMRIWYFDRNNLRRPEIEVAFSQEALDEALDEIAMLNRCWETKTPPPKPLLGTFQYKYSKFKNLINEQK